MRSIVGRTGGKTKIKKQIINLIPKHKTFVEPFVGGGAVFFGREEPSEVEVVNDRDPDIYHIYKDTQEIGNELSNADFTSYRDKFERLKKQKSFKSKKERLYRNLYLSINSFRADRRSYNEHKHKGRKSKPGKNFRESDYQGRLKGVKIFRQDYDKVMKKFDAPDTFFYLDPPYSRAIDNRDYEFNIIDIDELNKLLRGLKGKFLLSYDDTPQARKVFKGFKIRSIKTVYELGHGKKRELKELLISNY
tara:strand:+ start:262 stop:1005 length:744 start_codon:yes stop_codon:yes gene_type:complete